MQSQPSNASERGEPQKSGLGSVASHGVAYGLGIGTAVLALFSFSRPYDSRGASAQLEPAKRERIDLNQTSLAELPLTPPLEVTRVPVPQDHPPMPSPTATPTPLEELSCGELREELIKRTKDMRDGLERAIKECGYPPGELIPWGLSDIILDTPGDSVRRALESGSSEQVADAVSNNLLEVRGQLNFDLRSKLINSGTVPVPEVAGLRLPEYSGSTPKLSLGVVKGKDGTVDSYLIESSFGTHVILPVPEALHPQAKLILSLQAAGRAAEELDR